MLRRDGGWPNRACPGRLFLYICVSHSSTLSSIELQRRLVPSVATSLLPPSASQAPWRARVPGWGLRTEKCFFISSSCKASLLLLPRRPRFQIKDVAQTRSVSLPSGRGAACPWVAGERLGDLNHIHTGGRRKHVAEDVKRAGWLTPVADVNSSGRDANAIN